MRGVRGGLEQLRLDLRDRLERRRQGLLDADHVRIERMQLGAQFRVLGRQFGFAAADPGQLLIEPARPRRQLDRFLLQLHGLLFQFLDPALLERRLAVVLFDLAGARRQLCPELLPLGAQGRGLAFDVAEAALAGAQLIHGQQQLELFQVLPLRLVLPRLVRLALQRIHLPAHLADNVHDPDEVLLRLIEAAHRFLLLGQVFGNPAGFLEDHPALLRLRGEHHIDVALLDDCVGAAAQARPEEQLLDVAQTAGRLVDEAFALPGAVDPPGDGDFGEIDGQQALLVADRQRDLRYRERGPLIRAVEDDVLEAGGADVAGVVLAEHPPDGVYHITFATAFWPDDW